MKTKTRTQIIEIITRKGRVRPADLHLALKITPQALHRHLRTLKIQGVLEVWGGPPHTQYALSGVPDFKQAMGWLNAQPASSENPVCETRNILDGRLPRLKDFFRKGASTELLPLVISGVGEVGNNSFDHNLGQWRDVPGCWFEPQMAGKYLYTFIGDRGQGVRHSLARVYTDLKDDQTALEAAFEKVISGRAPEQRGNGLKFVKSIITGGQGRGLACFSGKGRVQYGDLGKKCEGILSESLKAVEGTVTLMVWRIS